MSRRRNNKREENLAIVLIDLPWQASVVVAALAFAVMRWVIPMVAKGPILVTLATMSSGFAPVAALFFLFIGGISFLKNRTQNIPELENAPSTRSNPTFEHTISDTTRLEAKPHITEWSLDLLRSLEWKRFEMLCAEYFRVLGKRVETIDQGADGGIDARIYKQNSDVLEFAIQCKSWNSMVGVKHVRELFGVMAHESAGKGIFMSTSSFSDDAKQFVADHNDKLFLIDGAKFISMISNLPEEKRNKLLGFATEGDYTTPSCASCGIKMIRRSGNKGEFWGCKNFPSCLSTFNIAA